MVKAIRVDGLILCPRCKIPMEYVSVTEKSSSGAKILRYYRCPACHTRLIDERIDVVRVDGGYRVKVVADGKTIITVVRPSKRKRAAR